jgi:NTP pyrophosphatase (non-canonical NTP hydrolase)
MSEALTIALREFSANRDWEKFHNPKNLAMALSVEAAELVEIFQWLTAQEASALSEDAQKVQAVEDEMADVFLYLLRMADVMGVDLEDAAQRKMQKNAEKYPVETKN